MNDRGLNILGFGISVVGGYYITQFLTCVGVGLFILSMLMGWTWVGIFILFGVVATVIVAVALIVIESIGALIGFKLPGLLYIVAILVIDIILTTNCMNQ